MTYLPRGRRQEGVERGQLARLDALLRIDGLGQNRKDWVNVLLGRAFIAPSADDANLVHGDVLHAVVRGATSTKAVWRYVDIDVEMVIEFHDNFVNFVIFLKTEEFLSNYMTIQLNCEN